MCEKLFFAAVWLVLAVMAGSAALVVGAVLLSLLAPVIAVAGVVAFGYAGIKVIDFFFC